MKRALLPMMLVALCGCATTTSRPTTDAEAQAIAGPMPDQIEAEKFIFENIKSRLKDPDSIKQFRISMGPIFVNKDVWMGLINGGNRRVIGWLYCAEYNAKNSYGAYGGVCFHD